MPAFDPSVPTTELDAVNSMLAAIGEQKLPSGTDLTTTGRADIDLAVDTLAKATRETLSAGWKFNFLYGYRLTPAAILVGPTLYNTFTVPSNAISWTQTKCAENRDADLIERPSERIADLDEMFIYNRTFNTDLFDTTQFPYLYIDMVEARDFEKMPESARRFTAVRAARQFAAQTVGSPELVGFTQNDEMQAFRVLKREHGVTERLNFLDTFEGYNWAGGRTITGDGRYRSIRRFP